MWKKIVLYNTTIDAFLKHDKKAILKMKQVFQFFAQQDDMTLIWRPHPLLEATLKSMRPGLLEAYLELAAYYKSNGIGIWDESSDPHRAIALSDVYYGDWSSLVELYRVTGKPILIQNMDVLEEDVLPVKWAFHAYTFQIYQNRIYTMAPKGDVLLSRGEKEKLSVIGHLPGGAAQSHLYSASVLLEGKIFFAPWKADSFSCYDIASAKEMEIPMEDVAGPEVFYLLQYHGDIWAIGMDSAKVYRYDREGNIFRCICPGDGERKLWANKRVKAYHYIPFSKKNTKELCIYDIEKNKWIDYPFQAGTLRDLLYDGEWCWIITEEGSVVRFDISAGVLSGEKRIAGDLKNSFMFDCGKELLLLPEKDTMCIRVQKETMEAEREILPVLEDGFRHYFSEITDTQLLVESYQKGRGWHLCADEGFRVYDYLENTVTWQDLEDADESCRMELAKLYAAEYWTVARKRDEVLVENPSQSLNFLCGLLYAAKEEASEAVQPCGKKIHECMMRNM